MRKQNCRSKLIIGITGSFGSGKTTVAGIFSSLGAEVIDADKIAHRVISPKTKVYKAVVNAFGRDILKKNGSIDRGKLSGIVFNDKELLGKLNKIIHPEVIRQIKIAINNSFKEVIVLDVPLLIEAGLKSMVDNLVVVKISRKVQIERLVNKTSLTKQEILKRIKAQMPLREKIRIADFIIDNNGTAGNTYKQAVEAWEKVRLLYLQSGAGGILSHGSNPDNKGVMAVKPQGFTRRKGELKY